LRMLSQPACFAAPLPADRLLPSPFKSRLRPRHVSRVPHPLRSLQRVGYATVGIEIRGIPPFAKSAKDGAPGTRPYRKSGGMGFTRDSW
jgi:hypothetical protein